MKIENYLPFARKLAYQKFSKSYCLPFEDFLSVAYLGLVKAYRNFDENKKIPFMVYAKIRISGELLDFIRKEVKFRSRFKISFDEMNSNKI